MTLATPKACRSQASAACQGSCVHIFSVWLRYYGEENRRRTMSFYNSNNISRLNRMRSEPYPSASIAESTLCVAVVLTIRTPKASFIITSSQPEAGATSVVAEKKDDSSMFLLVVYRCNNLHFFGQVDAGNWIKLILSQQSQCKVIHLRGYLTLTFRQLCDFFSEMNG